MRSPGRMAALSGEHGEMVAASCSVRSRSVRWVRGQEGEQESMGGRTATALIVRLMILGQVVSSCACCDGRSVAAKESGCSRVTPQAAPWYRVTGESGDLDAVVVHSRLELQSELARPHLHPIGALF